MAWHLDLCWPGQASKRHDDNLSLGGLPKHNLEISKQPYFNACECANVGWEWLQCGQGTPCWLGNLPLKASCQPYLLAISSSASPCAKKTIPIIKAGNGPSDNGNVWQANGQFIIRPKHNVAVVWLDFIKPLLALVSAL